MAVGAPPKPSAGLTRREVVTIWGNCRYKEARHAVPCQTSLGFLRKTPPAGKLPVAPVRTCVTKPQAAQRVVGFDLASRKMHEHCRGKFHFLGFLLRFRDRARCGIGYAACWTSCPVWSVLCCCIAMGFVRLSAGRCRPTATQGYSLFQCAIV